MRKIVIVEKDSVVRAVVTATLDNSQRRLFEAEDVNTALEVVSEERPDVVNLESRLQLEMYAEFDHSLTSVPNKVAARSSFGSIVNGELSGFMERSNRSAESNPVILLRAMDSENEADDALDSGSALVKMRFSPLELINDREIVFGPLYEASK